MGSVVYPQCRGKRGLDKVVCLVDAIVDDYRSGRIDRETAMRRLIYLKALNRSVGWANEGAVVRLIAEGLKAIGAKPKRGEFARILEREHAVAVAV